jgi:hypothetical protein
MRIYVGTRLCGKYGLKKTEKKEKKKNGYPEEYDYGAMHVN